MGVTSPQASQPAMTAEELRAILDDAREKLEIADRRLRAAAQVKLDAESAYKERMKVWADSMERFDAARHALREHIHSESFRRAATEKSAAAIRTGVRA